jgi:hypothetical protein
MKDFDAQKAYKLLVDLYAHQKSVVIDFEIKKGGQNEVVESSGKAVGK